MNVSYEQNALPRLPILGWSAFQGPRAAPVPSILSARHVRYTISGRAAIALALQMLQVKAGDKVLLPTYYCPTMITPVVQLGAQPLFYPITSSGAPDLEALKRMDLGGVRVMLAVHYFGSLQPMSLVRQFSVARGILFVEDCAHAFFGLCDGQPVGSWGDISIASLTKFFPVPEGGLIASHTRPLDTLKLSRRSWSAQFKSAADALEVAVQHHGFAGLNSIVGQLFTLKNSLRDFRRRNGARDTANIVSNSKSEGRSLLSSSRPATAVRVIAQVVKKERIFKLRRRNFMHLAQCLSNIRGAHMMWRTLSDTEVPYVFPLYVDNPEECYQEIRSAGIPIFRWDERWPGTPALKDDQGLDWATHVFQLGCHQDLSLKDIEIIADTVRKIVESHPLPNAQRASRIARALLG